MQAQVLVIYKQHFLFSNTGTVFGFYSFVNFELEKQWLIFFLSFPKTKRICESSRPGRGDHVTLGVGEAGSWRGVQREGPEGKENKSSGRPHSGRSSRD